MKNGSDNLNNAPVSADDRFAGQLGYRAGARRDPGGIVGDPTGDLTPRTACQFRQRLVRLAAHGDIATRFAHSGGRCG